MACLIRAPEGRAKGCVSFTTPERDQFINNDPRTRAAVEALKSRYLIGLHHNWHDHHFRYDPLFDFSMAGEGDLIEQHNRDFPRVNIDACNFAPPYFGSMRGTTPYWDVLNVSRAVSFKGIPEFLKAIRAIYDLGRAIRVLYLCPVPPADQSGTTLHDIRQVFESLFSPVERELFNLITMEWDYPFPLDLETLAFFYRSSRVYVHPAPEERRCRTAAYAWAERMPVVARANVASILPPTLRRAPFLSEFVDVDGMADAIMRAIDQSMDDPQWDEVAAEFSAASSGSRLAAFLDRQAEVQECQSSVQPININRLDIRLGRHHLGLPGRNSVPQNVTAFCDALRLIPDAELASISSGDDPELQIAALAAEQTLPHRSKGLQR